MPGAWTDFVDGSLQRLQDVALLRRLHPLQPSLDPMQAGVATALHIACSYAIKGSDHQASSARCSRQAQQAQRRFRYPIPAQLTDSCSQGFHHNHVRPLRCCQHVQVTVEDDVLRAWVSEHASAPAPGAAAEAGQQMHSLRMFATNDYLGLSTHARVRQAAADAAMAHGSGAALPALCRVVLLHMPLKLHQGCVRGLTSRGRYDAIAQALHLQIKCCVFQFSVLIRSTLLFEVSSAK